MKIVIVAYTGDKAGINIRNNLVRLNIEKLNDDKSNGGKNNIKIHTIEKEHIFYENLDKEIKGDLFLFVSKHRSEAGKKTLCVHTIGNYSDDNSFGGKKKTLVPTNGLLLRKLFLEMKKLKEEYKTLNEFEVTVEQTHHGPYLEKATLFIEIGSTEEEWTNKDAGELIAKAVFNVLADFNKDNGARSSQKIACILGGGHYNQVANKLLDRTEFCTGHICSKYSLQFLDEEMIKQMKEKSNADLFVFDWKSCGSEKQRIVEILDKLNIEHKKSKELLK